MHIGNEIKGPKKGMEGQKIFYIHYKELHAAVSATNKFKLSTTDDNHKLHEKVLRQFSKKCEIIPFRMNTIVGETVGRGILRKYYNELLRDLKKISGKIEFILYLTRTDKSKQVDFSYEFEKRLRFKGAVSRYMAQKKNSGTADKMFDVKNKVLVHQIHNDLEALASDTHTELMLNENLLLHAEYLIGREKAFDFKTTVTHLKNIYPNVTFILTGPLFPYDFISVKIMSDNTVSS